MGAILHFFRWRHDRVHLFELHVDTKLPCRLDGRELVESRWLTTEDALKLPLAPHVRRYLESKIGRILLYLPSPPPPLHRLGGTQRSVPLALAPSLPIS